MEMSAIGYKEEGGMVGEDTVVMNPA